jgi:hypothetical protein
MLEGGEPRHGLSGAGDDHVGAGRGQIDEFGELGLGLVDVDGLHCGAGGLHFRPP